jgi:hypothetical protein
MKKGNYYLARKTRLLRDFDRFSTAARDVLASRYGEDDAREMTQEIRRQYETLIPQIPYIGGKKNRLTENLIGTTSSLAVFKVLRARGETTEQIATLHQQMAETYLYSLPGWRFRLMRGVLSTRLGQVVMKTMLKRAAAASQRREYPAGFVFHFVEGNGEEYDFGIDYTECAIVKFFRAQGADEFTRYVCLFDYPHSRLSGTGLVRTMTLAEGAEKCDFRFRIGAEPENRQRTRIEDHGVNRMDRAIGQAAGQPLAAGGAASAVSGE